MLNIQSLLIAISLVESGGNDMALGRGGERSRYQITEKVWYQHSPYDFVTYARHTQFARAVAWKHILWIQDNVKPEQANDVYIVASCWNKGLARTKKNSKFQCYNDSYCKRVAALYHAIEHNKFNATKTPTKVR